MKVLQTLVIFLVLYAVAEAYATHPIRPLDSKEKEYQDKFNEWTRKWKKSYHHNEFYTRYQNFKNNIDYIEQFNNNNDHLKLGANKFADLTNDEYRATYLGSKRDGSQRLAMAQTESAGFDSDDNLPNSVDWRKKGAVTHVKDQGQCGSCYAFSATGSMEGAHFLENNTDLESLSEQNIIDCSKAEGNAGCNGGYMDQAFEYVIKNGGIDSEKAYPYEAALGKCRYNKKKSVTTISNWTDIPSGSEKALQRAVAKQGPISVGIDASRPSFQLYDSGIYNDPTCSSTYLDHGVLAVGYGDLNGKPYWLVKNSWGDVWGMDGYILMARNKNNHCGIATSASYPVV